MPILTGLFGVDVTDLIEAGASPAAILERRILEIERRVAELQRLAQSQQQSEEQSLMEQPRRPQPSTSSVEAVARAIWVAEGHNEQTLYQHEEFEDFPTDKRHEYALPGEEKRVMLLHYGWRKRVKQAAAAIEAIAAIPSPEREPMREALEKLAALRTMCEASNQPFYVEILDEIAAGIGLTWEALAPPTAQSGDRT